MGDKSNVIFNDVGNQDKAVLGTLEGPCADFVSPTRNGRKYSENLWEKVFRDPIVNEMIEQGGIPGELDHPVERTETDSSRIAILMREKPKKKNGKLWAKFDILNTPLGKILYTLAKAGFHIGISSRGSGDVTEDYNGNEIVDEDTYEFKCFDAVLLPSVKSARMNLVTEGLSNKFDYKKALKESLEKSNEKEKALMKKTLEDLNISLDDDIIRSVPGGTLHIHQINNDDYRVCFESNWNSSYDWCKDRLSKKEVDDLLPNTDLSEEVDSDNQETDFNIENQKDKAVEDSEADITNDFQDTIKNNVELKTEVTRLHEQLSICYAKEKVLKEEIDQYKSLIRKSAVNGQKVTALNSKINSNQQKMQSLQEQLKEKDIELENLTRRYELIRTNKNSLKECLDSSKLEVSELNQRIRGLEEQINLMKSSNKKQASKLLEDIETTKKNSKIKIEEYSQKLNRANSQIEKYKRITEGVIDKYISSQAKMLGINVNEIKNKLPSNYTLNDIDSICEDLREYKLSMNKLPFRSSPLTEDFKVQINSNGKESIIKNLNIDDEIDSQLLGLVNS